jgi:YegS/Rv2252/BmrU family lipid kinase
MSRAGFTILDVVPLDALDRLHSWVTSPQCPLIVAAGGDGTIGSVANYVANTEAVLGIIPLGTSNDVARSLQIPLDMAGAVRLLAHGKVATIDAGEFIADGQERRTFVHAAAIGLNVKFAQMATKKSIRSRLGPFTYVAAAILAMRHFDPFSVDLIVGDERYSLRLIHLAIINAPVFGGALGLTVPGSHVDDRRLDLMAVEDMAVRRLLFSAVEMLLGTRRTLAGVRVMHLSQVRIRTETPLEVTIDGEIAGRIPGDFRLAAEALRVITPRHFRDED